MILRLLAAIMGSEEGLDCYQVMESERLERLADLRNARDTEKKAKDRLKI